MSRHAEPVAAGALVLGAAALIVSASLTAGQVRPSSPETAQHMREHYTKVLDVEMAVIRGDLEGAHASAMWLAAHESSKELDKGSAAHIAAMRQAARQAADATDLTAAATATASMMAACGDCHRGAGVVPPVQLPARPEVGGTVGHMLAHQRAVDQMAAGLIIPSNASWKQGAEALKAAPLRAAELPRDPKLTREVAAAEDRVHVLADQAAAAAEEQTRVKAYAQIISSCAQCHSLHGRIWGPGIAK
ncbi:MAG TPA: hypothetical protein VK886_23530 [Vicinamibacterales bacterium]|nr:hypothetical protein [Vicinamibacterales bacterium]